MTPQPLRVLVWIMRRISSVDGANAALGDMLEDLADRTEAGRPPRWQKLWVNAQAIRILWSLTLSTVGRLRRSGWHTLTDAVRSLRRSPAYAILVIALLGVGIAAGTITYSVVDAVILRPLELDESDRVVWVSTWDNEKKRNISVDAFLQIRERVTGFEKVARFTGWNGASATIAHVTDEVNVTFGSSDLFQVLRFAPLIGRLWNDSEEMTGDHVVVVGYRFWKDRLNGDPNVVGQNAIIDRATYTVIGVLGAETDVPGLSFSNMALWLSTPPPTDTFGVIGRMRNGVTIAQIAQEIQQVAGTGDWRPDVTTLIDTYVRDVRAWMLLALGAAALVVLLACINAANIMLTRAFKRTHELAVRSSLGASRRQITLSVMTEGLVLSVTASVCALLFALWGIQAARVAVETYLPWTFRASTIALNNRVFFAAIAAAIVTGVLSSLVPAWQASRASVLGLLKDAGPTVTASGRSWRSRLLAGEIACVSVLLVLSWLFVTSLIRVIGIDLGVETNHLLAVSSNRAFSGTVDDVRTRLESVQGVTGVAVARGASLPLIGAAFGGAWATTTVERTDASSVPEVEALRYLVTSNYFDVAGIRFRRGSTWPPETASEAVVLEERAATQLFGADDPIGRQVRVASPAGTFTVVGVVPRVYTRGPEVSEEPAAYFPLPRSAGAQTFATFFFRTSRPPEEMTAVVTDALAPFAPPGNRAYVHTASAAVRNLTAERRFNGGLMSVFGGLAILIGAFGIYGVISATVAQQTREIGIRVALGATPGRIRQRVLIQAVVHVLAGLAVGLPAAWWISRGFAAYLFQVTPADPFVYAGVAALVVFLGLAAALIPAHRAARTDPLITLRS